jgi:hypothetical protein
MDPVVLRASQDNSTIPYSSCSPIPIQHVFVKLKLDMDLEMDLKLDLKLDLELDPGPRSASSVGAMLVVTIQSIPTTVGICPISTSNPMNHRTTTPTTPTAFVQHQQDHRQCHVSRQKLCYIRTEYRDHELKADYPSHVIAEHWFRIRGRVRGW